MCFAVAKHVAGLRVCRSFIAGPFRFYDKSSFVQEMTSGLRFTADVRVVASGSYM